MAHSSSSDSDINSVENAEPTTTTTTTTNNNNINNNINNNNNNQLEKQTTTSSSFSALESRAQSTISRIRSREPGQTAAFTHPLSHTKTGSDVIVDFDGPDDPYRPLNWGFAKKAVTTVLYGLTTMGIF